MQRHVARRYLFVSNAIKATIVSIASHNMFVIFVLLVLLIRKKCSHSRYRAFYVVRKIQNKT